MTSTPFPTALPSDLKRSNRMQILQKFRGGERCTANAIAEETGVSRQTVMKAIQFFIEKGYIVSLGKKQAGSSGGKPPELFSLSTRRHLICISLWPDRQNYTLIDLCGRRIAVERRRQALSSRADEVMREAGERCRALMAGCGVEAASVEGVCVSTSGIVDHRDNSLRYNSLRPAWGEKIPVAEALQTYFAPDTPVLVENVAKVVGRSILRRPDLGGRRAVTIFSSWGGVCSCFVEDGRILNGKDSLIGEIGHMVIAPDDDEVCGCGNRGCFERQVSDVRLRRIVRGVMAAHPESPLCRNFSESMTVGDVFSASAAGDAYARSIVERLARAFATVLSNIAVSFNPEIVVLHGDFARADAYFCEQVCALLRRFRYLPEGRPFELALDPSPIDELDVDGARTLLIDHLLEDASLYL